MNKIEQISSQLEQLLLNEAEAYKKLLETSPSKIQHRARTNILNLLKEVKASGDLALMISVEKAIVQNDLERYANSQMMEKSLRTALNELNTIQKLIDKVKNPNAYREIDEAYALPKNRQKGLPLDEARQAFKSHFARLVNMDKSRLDVDEKEIVETRQSLVNEGQRLYINLQNKALGIELKSSRKLSL